MYPTVNFGSAISDFNRSSTEYYIEVVDYMEGASDLNSAILRLNTELLAGNGPDLIYFFGLSPYAYANKGYLENLYAWMEADPELDRSRLWGLEALETDGALYTAMSGFTLNTLVCLEDGPVTESSWDLQAFQSLGESCEDGRPMICNVPRNSFLSTALTTALPALLSPETASCQFETDWFIAILEEAARMPEQPAAADNTTVDEVPAWLREGRSLLLQADLCSPRDLATLEAAVGQPLSLVGWSTGDGSPGSVLEPDVQLGMSVHGRNKAGAWAFLRYLLFDEEQQYKVSLQEIPVLREAFDTAAQALLHPFSEFDPEDVIPGESGGFFVDGVFYDLTYDPTPLITQRQYDMTVAAVESARFVQDTANPLWAIVSQEAEKMFAEGFSAADTARNIQSRAALYMSEQFS